MDGVLIIDKPAGLTSHDVVAQVRRILHERRVGHTGTLDPFATGVLAILVGRATRLAQFLSGAEKEYEAVIRLGYATDTGDLTGTRLQGRASEESASLKAATHDQPAPEEGVRTERVDEAVRDEGVDEWVRDKGVDEGAGGTPGVPVKTLTGQINGAFSAEAIESAMTSLLGEIDQVPPMYSAKKHQGRRLYEMARRGEEIERQPVRVKISAFEVMPEGEHLLTQNGDGSCDLAVRVVCSAGTYVRTLAEDFGKRLAVDAHLAALRRTRAGDFAAARSLTLEQLQEKADAGELTSILIPPDAALSGMPSVNLSSDDARRARHGMEVYFAPPHADWPDGQQLRMRSEDGQLIAIGVFARASRRLHPRVVIGAEK